MGVITSLGLNLEECWEGLVSGKSGIDYISHFDASNFPIKVAAEVKDFDPTKYVDEKVVDRNPRCVPFGLAAIEQAITSAGLDMTKERPERVGIVATNSIENDYIVKQNEVFQVRRGPHVQQARERTDAGISPETRSHAAGRRRRG